MNTLQNLIDNGIHPVNAQRMLDDYSSKIGTMNGIYEITDITYDFKERGRDVTLKCSLCGREIHRIMIKDRNKWSELIKRCTCQTKKYQKRISLEKTEKEKRDLILSRIGQIHGDYKIVSVEDLENNPQYLLRCTECGAETKISFNSFIKRINFDCTEHKDPFSYLIKYDESYIGRKKNFLTVKAITRLPNRHRAFLCECDCGNTTVIEPTMWEQEIVKSCGCKHIELISTHGHSKDRLYCVWNGILQRCYNPSSENYHNYGGRGITICPEWLNNIDTFFEWAYATGYDENAKRGICTIERKDVNGNYEPVNCEWITIQQQQKNKRTNVRITINGETKILTDWQKETGISAYQLKKIASGNNERKERKNRNTGFNRRVGLRISNKEKLEIEKEPLHSI